jgi:outer membrane receptor protein involved in Fe transport
MLVVTGVTAMAQSGAIKGTVVDAKNNEPIPFVGVVVLQNGSQVASGQTDFDGNYTIKPINPGKYTVRAVILGYEKYELNGVQVASDKIAFANIKMASTTTELKEFVKHEYSVPLFEKDQTTTGGTMTREQIANAPTRSINSVVSTAAGVSQADEGKGLNVKGGRSDATAYYVDGVRVRGQNPRLPNSGIDQITVITGGVPAEYGDVTSGVISITTRGPSKDYTGSAEVSSSQLTDQFGYNLVSLSASGPIYSKTVANVKTPVVGFFIAGEFEGNKDANPSAIGTYKVKDDVEASLRENPLRAYVKSDGSTGIRRNAEFVTLNDLENIKARQNAQQKLITLSGRLDYKPSVNSTLAFGGTYSYNNPLLYGGINGGLDPTLFNSYNNREQITQDFRIYGRFTQKFGSQESTGKSASILKNAFYTVQADYSDSRTIQQDRNFKDDFFRYGYIGKFQTTSMVNLSRFDKNGKFYNDSLYVSGRVDTLVKFTPGQNNHDYERYTINAFNFLDQYGIKYGPTSSTHFNTLDDISIYGGLRNGDTPDPVYGTFNNTGTTINGYLKNDFQQVKVSAKGSADIKNHAVSFGVEYEQRTERTFFINPSGLWTLARIEESKQVVGGKSTFRDTVIGGSTYHINDYGYKQSQTVFDASLRNSLHLDPTTGNKIYIDQLNPNQLALKMFSANELINGGNTYVDYYGYDYTGNQITSKQSFEQFFKDSTKRVIGAFQPNYIAGYIQDKFAFRDLIFNIGVRVDRYDANQKVLKDKYLLYAAKTAGEVGGPRPSNIGDNYVVYVSDIDNPNATTSGNNVVGYRNGDIFYDSRGTRIVDGGDVLRGGASTIKPYLADYSAKNRLNITSSLYNSGSVFTDYQAQVNIMPRVSFSFPISDDALFFAHYDVLTQRPDAGVSRIDMIGYLYLAQAGTINNPDLKPSKTTDYELGFKQKLSESSALTLSGFYRELRDMVQIINVNNAYPTTYTSYGNKDFGTVKGLTASFDLRRTNNISLTASYTLQFADGTGSAFNSGANLSATEPDLRTPIPLQFDQRHNIVTSIDYRYGTGSEYNGPILFGKRIFENTGVNIIFRAGSGTPYTRKGAAIDITDTRGAFLVGTINGSRLPWSYRTDLKIDKEIPLHFGKAGEDKNPITLNVYALVQNLFDVQNILGVYSFTGSPTDDGYLASSLGQSKAPGQTNPQSYRDLYNVYISNPNNFSIPRRIRLGISINF